MCENRAFLGRAIRYLAGEAGIIQFLDLGSGLPGVGNVHEVAQAVQPGARVVYVDNDPIVLAHGRRCSPAPLKDAALFTDEEEPGKIVETLVDALPPGSYVVASHGTAEYSPPQKVDGGIRAYQQGGMPLRLRDGDEFADLVFKGLTLVPPGLVVVSDWRPEPGTLPLAAREVGMNGAVARKP